MGGVLGAQDAAYYLCAIRKDEPRLYLRKVRDECLDEIEREEEEDRCDQDGVRGALEEGADFTVEFRAGLVDGKVRWNRIQGQVLYDEAGKPIRMIGISIDVPQGRHVEEAR